MLMSIGCGGEIAESAPTTAPSFAASQDSRVIADPDVDESTVRVHFASSTSRYIAEAAACSVRLRVDDIHVFDMRAGDRRCATTPMPDAAIPVVVRADAQHVVVVEATTAGDVTPVWLRLVLPQIALSLQREVEAAHVRLREARSAPSRPNHGVKSGAGAGIVFSAIIGGLGLLVGLLVAAVSGTNRAFGF